MTVVQLFVVSTSYGAIAAAAAIDSGVVPSDRGERVLLAVNGAPTPEVTRLFADDPHMASVLARFDRVEVLNPLIAPQLPITWEPRPPDLPTFQRLLRRTWRLGDAPVDLYLQSPQVPPATTLAAIFPGAPIVILGDGLMTYGPLRSAMPWLTRARVSEVHYVDVVPGIRPVLFSEVPAVPVPLSAIAFRAVLDEVADAAHSPALEALTADPMPTALVLGQYLAALGLVSEAEEDAMQREMVEVAHSFGARRIVFKPHPSAPPAAVDGPHRAAQARGMAFEVYSGGLPAEVVAMKLDVVGAVAGFSTALPTLAATLGTRIGSVGNELLLQRLTPYENSNRIPVTIIDALTRSDSPYRDPTELQLLVDAVSFCMQPGVATHLRERATAFLTGLPDQERDRYFRRRRLSALDLPGALPPRRVVRAVTAVVGAERSRDLRDLYRAARARASRVCSGFRA